ncbi:hypothetical protein GCM10007391_11270 [Alteromonas halophila]|uniref:DUF1249 domain-containing protein n=1 Tax=Alteromonas halophila TaxID=516698 RepID=A0A918MX92_9ALTE|nr:hypothetical protein GCM10007391_11270 [Alteromonas halophila]
MPDLPKLQALCELNYTQFLQILPDCDAEHLSYAFSVSAHLRYVVQITEAAPYTTTVSIEQQAPDTPTFLKPKMTVRLYHDARMAEVLSSQNTGALNASYPYPNQRMRQRNEKFLVNLFLAEWLDFCLKQQPKAVSEVQ